MSPEQTIASAAKRLARLFWILFGCAIAQGALLVFVTLANAANFSITPTSLELSAATKSGAFSVINSGEEKLNCQIDVKEWSQDESGKDIYTETKDVVFFPRIMTVEPNEQRAIRIGIKVPAGLKEKSYRLFVDEIPSPRKETEAKGPAKQLTAGLTIAIRYATPVFVVPAKPQQSASVEQVGLASGVASAAIKNAGNVHLKLLSVTFRGKTKEGKELFSKDLAGWYVLPGLSRRYEAPVPEDVCNDLATIEVSAQADHATIGGTWNVDRNRCTR